MKTLGLVFCFICGAALLAGMSGPADTPSADQVKAPAQSVTPAPVKECTVPTDADFAAPKATCFMCSKSGSTGACKGADECGGSRSGCRKKGCKITGTRSCSTAANNKRC